MQKTISFLIGALTGALVGATLAVMLAPEPGKTLREDIRGRFMELKDQMQQAATDRRAELEGRLAELQRPPEA